VTKFSTYVGDALKFHDTAHGAIKAAVRLATRDDDMGLDTMTEDDWSPEARAAAAEARKKHSTFSEKHAAVYNKHGSSSYIGKKHFYAAQAHGQAMRHIDASAPDWGNESKRAFAHTKQLRDEGHSQGV
jgi:hypothetical protein